MSSSERSDPPVDRLIAQLRDKWNEEYPIGVPWRRMLSDLTDALAHGRPLVADDNEPWRRNLVAVRELVCAHASRKNRHHLLAALDEAERRLGAEGRPPVAVTGRLDRSLADFERACLVHLDEEQQRANPDNALIGVLCDAVRLVRERNPVDFALHTLRNSGIDTECGACMEVAFTGVTTAPHTCPGAGPQDITVQQDAVCSHGTALDVHCCNCHSGFIFDSNHECPPPTEPG